MKRGAKYHWSASGIVTARGFSDVVQALIRHYGVVSKGGDISCEELVRALLLSIIHPCLATIKLLLQEGGLPDQKTGVNLAIIPPFHAAAKIWDDDSLGEIEDRAEILTLLLNAGAKVNEKEVRYNTTALHVAALDGSHLAVEALLAAGAAYNTNDSLQRTPLHCAAMSRTSDALRVAQLLLDGGCPLVIAEEESHLTPISYAVESGNLAVLRFFMDVATAEQIKQVAIPLHTAPDNSRLKPDIASLTDDALNMAKKILFRTARGKNRILPDVQRRRPANKPERVGLPAIVTAQYRPTFSSPV